MRRIIFSDGVGTADGIITARGVVMSDGSPSLSCGVLLGDDDGTGDGGATTDGVIARGLHGAAGRAMPRGDVIASMLHAAAAALAAPA